MSAEDVGVAGVSAGFLDHVGQDPNAVTVPGCGHVAGVRVVSGPGFERLTNPHLVC